MKTLFRIKNDLIRFSVYENEGPPLALFVFGVSHWIIWTFDVLKSRSNSGWDRRDGEKNRDNARQESCAQN